MMKLLVIRQVVEVNIPVIIKILKPKEEGIDHNLLLLVMVAAAAVVGGIGDNIIIAVTETDRQVGIGVRRKIEIDRQVGNHPQEVVERILAVEEEDSMLTHHKVK